MATIFTTPKGYDCPLLNSYFMPPDGRFDNQAYSAAIEAWKKRLADWAKTNYHCPESGEIVSWGMADGYASYMVIRMRPLELIHLNDGDGYRLQAFAERGLRVADIRQKISQHKAMRKLFSQEPR